VQQWRVRAEALCEVKSSELGGGHLRVIDANILADGTREGGCVYILGEEVLHDVPAARTECSCRQCEKQSAQSVDECSGERVLCG
jgi:hypothetical protein